MHRVKLLCFGALLLAEGLSARTQDPAAPLVASSLIVTPVSAQEAVAGVSFDLAVQARRRLPAGQEPQKPFDWRAYFLVDSNAMAATATFDAVFEKTTFGATGFGGEVLNVWRRLFARVAVSTMEETGSRAVVFDGDVVSLGIPLRLKLRPIEIGAGWRLSPLARGRVVPYGGGGLLHMSYIETSDFADAGENSKTSFSGQHVFGGVEVRVAPWIVAGVEGQFRSIADALGGGGLSKEFGESNLGGTTLRFLVGVRR